MAHKDGDSEYYLHHNFSLGEGSFGAEFGSIMLSGENAGDFSDEVNILYGHHMRNGSMFALFAEFRDSAIFNEHRTIYLLTPEWRKAAISKSEVLSGTLPDCGATVFHPR